MTGLVGVQAADASSKAGAFADARKQVRQAINTLPTFAQTKMLQRLFPQIIRRIARDSRQSLAPVWMAAQLFVIAPICRMNSR